MTVTPRAFISYSWTNPIHEDWVINLAERLVSDGVDVVIDKWTLKEGQDKFNLMESMVKATDIDKVLILLDSKYADKANERSGGVGTETQIISPQIYENVSQEKFIPIIAERDEKGNPFIPTYLEGRIYIDLSEQEQYEQNYETLLRNIFKRPAFSKPKLGKAPSYLFEETPMTHRTTSIIRGFDNQINKNPKRVNSILRDFLDEFFQNIKSYSVNFSARDPITMGKEICESINAYTPLRNDFISFFDKLTKEEISFDIETIIKFLERLPLLTTPQDDRSSWSSNEFANFKFFIHELFLYLIAIGIKNENYKFVEELLYSGYFFHEKYNSELKPENFKKFYHHFDIIKPYYDQTFSKNLFSPMADLMITRIPEGITKEFFIEADLLCHYVGVLKNINWFPITYVYMPRGKSDLFGRLVSARHFEKVKLLFNCATAKDLKEKLNNIKENDKNPERMSYPGSFDTVLPIYQIININAIATTR
jgi:hypothetical protein